MSDVTFSAKVTISREVDPYGLPVTTADVEVDEYAAALPLPAGREGPQGSRGRPKPTWRKRGSVTNASALALLDPADREYGHWWHNLATNGMETWTDIGWVSSPGAVGPEGPRPGPYSLSATGTTSEPALTVAGAQIVDGSGPQQLKVTVPAGAKGGKGPIGTAGDIVESADYDDTLGPSNGSLFGWNRGTKKFRPLPFPNGFGPWQSADADFRDDEAGIVDDVRTMGSLTIPPQPFAWRPYVYGMCRAAAGGTRGQSFVHAHVRMNTTDGVVVAYGINPWWDAIAGTIGGEVFIRPSLSRNASTGLTASVVPAGVPVTLLLTMERQSMANAWKWWKSPGYLSCYALPVI
ncbi:hypothetical protein [Rhodococcus sp. NPDC060176]|uniref:hypothetical protein n=1 Tax=Rhodococcus sp. NPDC060176 TaxID=3347062 RepID=UPI003651D0C6